MHYKPTSQPKSQPVNTIPPDGINLGSTDLEGQRSPNHEVWVKSLRLSGRQCLHSYIKWNNPIPLTEWLQASSQLMHIKSVWAWLVRGLSSQRRPSLLLWLLILLLMAASPEQPTYMPSAEYLRVLWLAQVGVSPPPAFSPHFNSRQVSVFRMRPLTVPQPSGLAVK